MAPILEVQNISYMYEDQTMALNDISLCINAGEKVAILGPNGAGKSTLLHLLAGLKNYEKGSIKIFGKEAKKKNVTKIRTRLGILFQDPDDQIFMPRVWDDIAFGPINQGLNADEVHKKVKQAMEHLGLNGFENRVPHHLSYGEKKKVAVAGVLAMDPEILFLDEPTANLDMKARKELLSLIQNLNTTVILATHDIHAALSIVERVYILNKTIIAQGSISEIFSNNELLEASGLEQPEITKLFTELHHAGTQFQHLPLTIQDAVKLLQSRLKS